MHREITALTGLRGVAALWVVIYHMHEFNVVPGPFGTMVRHGYLAVDIFFVLSGFVMALSYKDLFGPNASKRNFAVFLLRRVARIYPLYAVLTLAAAALYAGPNWGLFSRKQFGVDLIENLLLIESWGLGRPLDGPGWSISTEAMAYVLFPILATLTVYARPARALLVAAAAFALLAILPLIPTPVTYPFPRQGPLDIAWEQTVWPLLRCLTEFSIGLAAFRLAHVPAVIRFCSSSVSKALIATSCVVLLFMPGLDLLFVALVAPLIVSLAVGGGSLNRLLSLPVALLLGRLSYSIYLLHGLLLPMRPAVGVRLRPFLGDPAADVTAVALFYAALFILALLCYAYLERPAREAIRHLEARLFPRESRPRQAAYQVASGTGPDTPV